MNGAARGSPPPHPPFSNAFTLRYLRFPKHPSGRVKKPKNKLG
jgi:hypothetical protein